MIVIDFFIIQDLDWIDNQLQQMFAFLETYIFMYDLCKSSQVPTYLVTYYFTIN